MKKMYCVIAQMVLLLWFFLDMIGLNLGNKCLVTRSYKEDGIFFLIYLVAMILFITKEKIGKWFVIGWMSMWFVIQLYIQQKIRKRDKIERTRNFQVSVVVTIK